jgi:hypothetical protein
MSGRTAPDFCPETSCLNKQLVGAHVQKDSAVDKKWYIVPLCAKHNAKAESLEVADWVTLVSANVEETCQKSLYGSLAGLGGLYPLRR